MIVGAVDANGDAVIGLRVRGSSGKMVTLDCVVDTGFNGSLALSLDAIESLGLVLREEARYTLADGSETSCRIFLAEVEWLGTWRRTLVPEMSGGPLVGMALMTGCRLCVDVVPNGRVEIRPIAR